MQGSRPQTDGEVSCNEVDYVSNQRMRAAANRALESHQKLTSMAERLCEEMDDATPPLGVPVAGLSPDDSMVMSISGGIAAHKQR